MHRSNKPLGWILLVIGLALLVGCTADVPLQTRPTSNSQLPSAPLVGVAPPLDNFTAVPTAEAAHTPLAPTRLPVQTTSRPALDNPVPPAFPIPGMELEQISPPALDLARQAGAYWIRRNSLRWDLVEPAEGERRWEVLANLEQEMARVAASGGQMLVVVRSAPEWAQASPGIPCGPLKADKREAFALFIRDVVARYHVSPYQVQYWEIGNEPDIDPSAVTPDSLFGCMGNMNDAGYGGGEYAGLLKVIYPQVKAADPAAQVLVGGLLMDCDPINPPEDKDCSSALFLEGILKAGGGDYFDGVSFHGYDFYFSPYVYANPNWHSSWDILGPVFITKARYLRSLLVAYQQPEKYLINTEAGLLCGRDGSEAVCQTAEFMSTKAYYAAEMNFAALGEGLRGNIWYSLTGWRGTHLVENGLQPNQAYQAYRFASGRLAQAAFEGMVNDFPGVRGYQVSLPDHKLWFLLAADGQTHTIQLPFQPTAIYDVYGEPQALSAEISLTGAPRYIEWVP